MPDPSRLDTVLLPSNSSEPGSTSDCQSVAKKPHKPFMESHEAASQLRGSSRASATSDNDYDMWPSTETLWIGTLFQQPTKYGLSNGHLIRFYRYR